MTNPNADKVVELYKQGVLIREIADRLDLTYSSTYSILDWRIRTGRLERRSPLRELAPEALQRKLHLRSGTLFTILLNEPELHFALLDLAVENSDKSLAAVVKRELKKSLGMG